MVKEISDRLDVPEGPMQGYADKMHPYYFMLEYLYKGKNKTEREDIRKDFEESFTYLLIAEKGKYSPPLGVLKHLYQMEQKEGLKGFINTLLYHIPSFIL